MNSRNFAALSDDRIASFLSTPDNCDTDILDAIESPTDLWLLANMQKSFSDLPTEADFPADDIDLSLYDIN